MTTYHVSKAFLAKSWLPLAFLSANVVGAAVFLLGIYSPEQSRSRGIAWAAVVMSPVAIFLIARWLLRPAAQVHASKVCWTSYGGSRRELSRQQLRDVRVVEQEQVTYLVLYPAELLDGMDVVRIPIEPTRSVEQEQALVRETLGLPGVI